MQRKHCIYIFIILVLVLIIMIISRREASMEVSADETSGVSVEKAAEYKQPTIQEFKAVTPSESSEAPIFEEKIEIKNSTPTLPEIVPENPNEYSVADFLKKTENLFVSQKIVSPKEELIRLRVFDDIVTPYEKSFFNAFQAKLGSKRQTMRLNITFNRDFKGKGQGFCLAIKDDLTGQFLNFISERDIHLLRSDDPGYIVISVKNQIFLQIFATTDKKPSRFKAYFTNFDDIQKLPLIFEEKPIAYDGTRLSCEDFW